MENQLPDSVKEERNQDLLRVIDGLARAKGEAMVGSRVDVLCEGPSKTNESRLSGRSPDNKIVIFEGGERLIGQIFPVQIERSSGFSVYGTPAIHV
jgi:tRNA-2-methylthio-N6-dimethylallyladenosine synthase